MVLCAFDGCHRESAGEVPAELDVFGRLVHADVPACAVHMKLAHEWAGFTLAIPGVPRAVLSTHKEKEPSELSSP